MQLLAQTVTGPVPASALGLTLMHEHILCDLRQPADRLPADAHPPITTENRFETDYFQNRNPLNMFLDEDDVAIADLVRFRAAGGGSIVELTVGGMAPQPERLREIAEASGVNVIAGAGYYVDAYLDEPTRAASVGADREHRSPHSSNERALGHRDPRRADRRDRLQLADHPGRATHSPGRGQGQWADRCRAHHPSRPSPGRAARDRRRSCIAAGGDPARTVIGHMDRTVFDQDRLVALLAQGFVLEWDFFGIETSQYWMAGVDLDLPTDYMRLDILRRLIEHGYRDQLCLSHDICTRTRLTAHGGHGYRHLPAHVVPLMRRRGFTDREISALLVDTPARLLCYLSEPTGAA